MMRLVLSRVSLYASGVVAAAVRSDLFACAISLRTSCAAFNSSSAADSGIFFLDGEGELRRGDAPPRIGLRFFSVIENPRRERRSWLSRYSRNARVSSFGEGARVLLVAPGGVRTLRRLRGAQVSVDGDEGHERAGQHEGASGKPRDVRRGFRLDRRELHADRGPLGQQAPLRGELAEERPGAFLGQGRGLDGHRVVVPRAAEGDVDAGDAGFEIAGRGQSDATPRAANLVNLRRAAPLAALRPPRDVPRVPADRTEGPRGARGGLLGRRRGDDAELDVELRRAHVPRANREVELAEARVPRDRLGNRQERRRAPRERLEQSQDAPAVLLAPGERRLLRRAVGPPGGGPRARPKPRRPPRVGVFVAGFAGDVRPGRHAEERGDVGEEPRVGDDERPRRVRAEELDQRLEHRRDAPRVHGATAELIVWVLCFQIALPSAFFLVKLGADFQDEDDSYIDQPAAATVERIKLYGYSMQRYGKSPFIYPVWGIGGMPEGFSRCVMTILSPLPPRSHPRSRDLLLVPVSQQVRGVVGHGAA